MTNADIYKELNKADTYRELEDLLDQLQALAEQNSITVPVWNDMRKLMMISYGKGLRKTTEMTDPTKKIYSSIQEGLLDVARLGVKNYEKIKMTDKEMEIRASILPQLESIANQLWDDGNSPDGRRMDAVIKQLREILSGGN
jgi:wyosine [tRNA(Phe)-imidazoG37] synthetase (radical SAM superfamily)